MAVAAAQWGATRAPVADVAVGARLFAPGEAFDGEALPLDHPLLLPAAFEALSEPAAHSAHRPQASPLALRRFCAWGRPGRMPYRGTVDEALLAAQLPQAVRDQSGAAITARRPDGRVTIANDAIRSQSGGRIYDTHGFAMSYGRTLCLGTRVNFKPGHTEAASLYEAQDTDGRLYSVMVPDVCGNISVIKARAPGPGSSGIGLAALPGPDPWEPDGPGFRIAHAEPRDKPHEVPVPGTLALALLALAVLSVRRRAGLVRQACPADDTQPHPTRCP